MAAPTIPVLSSGGGGSGVDERVKVSIMDTTAGFLSSKLAIHVDTPIAVNILNPGANETLQLSLDGDQVHIDWIPTNYVRNASPVEAIDLEDLTSHLKGIDDALASLTPLNPVMQFTLNTRVPNAGTQYMYYGNVLTSVAPVTIASPVSLYGASVHVNIADPANTYDVQFLVNGVVRETLTLGSTLVEAISTSFTYAMIAGDDLSVRLVRTAGAGVSNFTSVAVKLLLGV